MKRSQRDRILDLLREHPEGIYTYQFFDLNPPIIRPAARIIELRKLGYIIKTDESTGVARYILEENMNGYDKFKLTGVTLFGGQTKIGKKAYSDMETADLLNKQKIAEVWLKENETHPKYNEALKRYEDLCDAITLKLLT